MLPKDEAQRSVLFFIRLLGVLSLVIAFAVGVIVFILLLPIGFIATMLHLIFVILLDKLLDIKL